MQFFVGHFIDRAYDNHGERNISRVRTRVYGVCVYSGVHSPLPQQPRLVIIITDTIVLKHYNNILRQMINLHTRSLYAPSNGPRSPHEYIYIPTARTACNGYLSDDNFSPIFCVILRPNARRDRETVFYIDRPITVDTMRRAIWNVFTNLKSKRLIVNGMFSVCGRVKFEPVDKKKKNDL